MVERNSNIEEQLEKLRLFNEKAEKLARSDLLKHLIEKGMSLNLKITKENPTKFNMKVEMNIPSEGAVDAFMNNYRFFCQNNEGSSFHNMQEVYNSLPITSEQIHEFNIARTFINQFLDSPQIFLQHL